MYVGVERVYSEMRDRREVFFERYNARDLLKGHYELSVNCAGEDRNLTQNFAENVLNQFGLLYEPILDNSEGHGQDIKPTWPEDKEFGVCLTHDVDKIHPWSDRELLRAGYREARLKLSRSAPISATKSLAGHAVGALKATRKGRTSPGHYFDKWLEAERSVGANSTFFFCPERPTFRHQSNTVYRYNDPVEFDGRKITVADLMQTLRDRGNEIGLHAFQGAMDDPEVLRSQRRQVASASAGPVESVRHHWLLYDISSTPKAQADAGLKYDSTLAVTGNVGFRFGTSYPWRLYDLQAEKSLDVVEIPLVIQDTALFDQKYMGLSGDKALEYVIRLGEHVKEVSGVLTLNWHPNTTKRGERHDVYRRALEKLEGMGAWFGTVAEIGEVWENSGNDFRTA